jgi:hypothetical protein
MVTVDTEDYANISVKTRITGRMKYVMCIKAAETYSQVVSYNLQVMKG